LSVCIILNYNGRPTGLVTTCPAIAFYNTLLKGRQKEGWKLQDDEEEGIRCYWMSLMKGENIGN
jgi:hypothetical protein